MSDTISERWHRAVAEANELTLPERWQNLTQQWTAAVDEYRELYHAAPPDVARLRKVTRRVHDLQQQRQVMRYALAR